MAFNVLACVILKDSECPCDRRERENA